MWLRVLRWTGFVPYEEEEDEVEFSEMELNIAEFLYAKIEEVWKDGTAIVDPNDKCLVSASPQVIRSTFSA